MTLFIGFLLLTIFIASNKGAAFLYFLKFLEFSFIFFFSYKNFKFYKKLFYIPFLLGIFFETTLGILQFLNQGSINGIFYFLGERSFTAQTPNIALADISGKLILRPYGTFPHPNVFSAYLLLSALVLFFSIGKNTWENRIIYFGVFIASIGIILSLSRISILLFLLLLIWFLLRNLKLRSYKNLIMPTTVLFVSLISLFSFLPGRFQNILSDTSYVERIKLIKASLLIIYQNPTLGVGLNNFLNRIPDFILSGNFFYLQPVHNIFLLFVSETGLLGLFFLSSFFIASFFRAKDSTMVMFLIIIVLGSFDHFFLTIQQGGLMLSIFLGIIWSKDLQSKKRV